LGERSKDRGVELQDAEFYRVLRGKRLEQVRPLLIEKRFHKKRALFFEGEPAAYLWTIQRGEVRLYKSSGGGRITTLDVLEPGQIFGAVSALADESYPASAEGVTGGIAWCLPRKVFLRLMGNEPELVAEVLRVVAGRLNDAQELVRSLAHDPAPSRIAQALLRAAHGGEARVTRRALAESAGTTVETAIRILRGFERDGLIQGRVERIILLDERGVDAIATSSRS
jgi:CRP/FNR family cyclic AMP-dependent transcriptional regulator